MKIQDLKIGDRFTTKNVDRIYTLKNIVENNGVVTYYYIRLGTAFKTTNKNLKVTLVN